MVKRLLEDRSERDTRNLKAIIYGGGPMYQEYCLAALERVGSKLTQLYGQGESPMTITALSARQHARKSDPQWRVRLTSIGVAQSAVDVRIAGANVDALPPGEVGEVVVRGDSVMSGYWENPEATSEAIRDGWLHTGDFDALDTDGFLTLKDRLKDLIISGGSDIYPREIEEVLLRHPHVSEASVIGRQNEEWGEEVVAFIVGTSVNESDLTHYAGSMSPPSNVHATITLSKACRKTAMARCSRPNCADAIGSFLRSMIEQCG